MRQTAILATALLLGASLAAEAQTCTPRAGGMVVLQSIPSTHRMPAFRAIDNRNLFGNTELDVLVLENGRVGAITILRSSGQRSLDAKFADYVKKNWRWRPPYSLQSCRVTQAHTTVSVNFFDNNSGGFGTDAANPFDR